jgi:hypothetical protein
MYFFLLFYCTVFSFLMSNVLQSSSPIFCSPCVSFSADLVNNILLTSCPIFCSLRVKIFPSPLLNSVVLLSNVLLSFCPIIVQSSCVIFCDPHVPIFCSSTVHDSGVLISDIMVSSCPIFCSPHVQYYTVLLSNILQP